MVTPLFVFVLVGVWCVGSPGGEDVLGSPRNF